MHTKRFPLRVRSDDLEISEYNIIILRDILNDVIKNCTSKKVKLSRREMNIQFF